MKIAIVKLSALGDIVHAMVVLQFIKKYNQEIEIDWVVEKSFKGLLEFNSGVHNVHVVNLKNAKNRKSLSLLLKELRKVQQFGSYDLVIDLQGLLKSAVISRLIPSTITLGFDKSSIRETMASMFYNKTFKYGYHENVIERNFELTKFALGFPFSKEELHNKVPFLNSNNKYLEADLSSVKKNILLIPGASHLSKCYPVSKLAKLTNILDANFLIIWGNQNEKILAEEIKDLSPKVNVCDKLSLEVLISLVNEVDLVIGPDTGPTHMAWALNKPSITLFGPTPGYRNIYSTNINRVIQSGSNVNPYKIDKNDYSIVNIDVDEIVKIATLLLNDNI